MFLWQYAKYQKFQDFFPVSVYVRSSFGDSFPLRLPQEFNFVSSFRNEFSFYLMFIFIADPISMFTRFSFHLQKYTEKKREKIEKVMIKIPYFSILYCIYLYIVWVWDRYRVCECIYTHNSIALKYVITTSHMQHTINCEHFSKYQPSKNIQRSFRMWHVCVRVYRLLPLSLQTIRFRVFGFLTNPFFVPSVSLPLWLLLLILCSRCRCRCCCCSFWLHSPVFN